MICTAMDSGTIQQHGGVCASGVRANVALLRGSTAGDALWPFWMLLEPRQLQHPGA